ncbi:hypothetical protein [uncultured Chryseobacterium sp.]|uniref:hypothetical protein n=1 Tax=uncultured Chryseobacterium sp. TaxID=259322 RepID=UPI00374962FC
MKTKKIVLFIIYFIKCGFSFAQKKEINYTEERHKFNKKLIVNRCYNMVKKQITNNDEFKGSFLGLVKTKTGKTYFIVKSSYIFNLNKSATAESQIFVYNYKNEFVGYYYLSNINQLPWKLFHNKLYFNNKDCREKIIVDFTTCIPNAINLKCNGVDDFIELK